MDELLSVTMPVELWAHVLDAIENYRSDEDARYDYPETAAALDEAYPIIGRAYYLGVEMKAGK